MWWKKTAQRANSPTAVFWNPRARTAPAAVTVCYTTYGRTLFSQNIYILLFSNQFSKLLQVSELYKNVLYPIFSVSLIVFLLGVACCGLIPRPLGRFILGVRGICSPAYASLSKMNLQYPAALRRGFFIIIYNQYFISV